jgi:hypothetical protein
VAVSLVALVEGPSVDELTSVILAALADMPADEPSQTAGPGTANPQQLPTDVDELSDESVDALLRRMLAEP